MVNVVLVLVVINKCRERSERRLVVVGVVGSLGRLYEDLL